MNVLSLITWPIYTNCIQPSIEDSHAARKMRQKHITARNERNRKKERNRTKERNQTTKRPTERTKAATCKFKFNIRQRGRSTWVRQCVVGTYCHRWDRGVALVGRVLSYCEQTCYRTPPIKVHLHSSSSILPPGNETKRSYKHRHRYAAAATTIVWQY